MGRFSADSADENQLWRAFKSGDSEAYARLYDAYFDVLYRYGRKITPDTFLVEDCIQDLFVALWRNRQTLGDVVSPKFYLFRSLRNRIVAHLRGNPSESLAPDAGTAGLAGATPSPESLVIEAETARYREVKVEAALQDLTKREREAIFLKFYSGLSSEEISRVMGIGIPSVYNLINRAITQLQHHVDKLMLLVWLLSAL
ncbi:MAG: sigma-70 family RNA polymerase sigma factor [Cytophagales bacterium]|nr:sigma-70 family RNA polymerase sigma factor [Cytophagales bacterium]